MANISRIAIMDSFTLNIPNYVSSFIHTGQYYRAPGVHHSFIESWEGFR